MDPCRDFITSFTDQFSWNTIFPLNKEYYLQKKTQRRLLKDIPEQSASAGLYLGKKDNKRFLPAPALLELLAPYTEKKITLNEKGSWLFICGRDPFNESIVVQGNLNPGELCIVVNGNNEVLGLAQKASSGRFKNFRDIGIFLRQEH